MAQPVMANIGGQPVLILSEGTTRSRGKEAQKNNIAAAVTISEAIRATLGPKGMDKMLVDSIGDVVITNDGAKILEEMHIEHPAAKMMVEVAKTQDKMVGDGTTTAVVLAGELLKKAGELLDDDIHPTVITKGFKRAKDRALEALEKIAVPVDITDVKLLTQIANTAMTGKSAERASDVLSQIAVEATKKVAEKKDARIEIDAENVKIEKKEGGAISDTVLIEGIIMDKEIVHSSMPKVLQNAKIALLDCALELKELGNDAKISIDAPGKMQAFLDEQESMLRDMVAKVIDSGANAVFCQKGIDDVAQYYLAKKGVIAARRVKKSDIEALARATGAKIVSNMNDLSREDLGHAGLIQEKKIAGDAMIFVEKCKTPKVVTILIRGGTEHVVDEIKMAMEDAIKGIASALELGKVVAGGGAAEMAVAMALREYAGSFEGREQLAVNAFASAMEIIPRSLAENAGMDPIDKLASLRSAHDKSRPSSGLDVFTGNVTDMLKAGVIEPLKTKVQALTSASEVAEMILRIDDIIQSSGSSSKEPPMPPGGMGGMGGGGMY